MTALEKMKLEAELAAAGAAKLNMLVRIEEFKNEIQKLEEHVKVQLEAEEKLKQKIQESGK